MEAKEDLRARLGRSPDLADALSMAIGAGGAVQRRRRARGDDLMGRPPDLPRFFPTVPQKQPNTSAGQAILLTGRYAAPVAVSDREPVAQCRGSPMAKTYVAAVGVVLAAACTDLSSPRGTGPLALRGAASGVQQSRSFLTLDDEFAAIASAEPSFAGVYLDSTHTPVVLLTNTTRLAEARTAGVDGVLQKRHLSTGNLRVRPAAYGFGALKQWYDSSLNDIASVPGFVFADIDEVQNRLH
jgi:hypothetical protein